MNECAMCHRASGKRACPLKIERKICARCCQMRQLNYSDCPAACQFLKVTTSKPQPSAVAPPAPVDVQRHLNTAPTRIRRRYGTISRREAEVYLDVLQNLEAGIVYAANRDERINDAEVMQALCALMVIYEAEEQGQTPVLPSRAEPVQAVVDQTQNVVRMRADMAASIPLPLLLRCLHRIHDSVMLWTEREGPRGYLDFVRDYVAVSSDVSEPLRLAPVDKGDGHAWTPEEQVEYLINRSADLLEAGRLDEAIVVLEKARQFDPDEPGVAVNLSSAYIQKDRWDEATQILESARAQDPNFVPILTNLAPAYLVAGREDDALQTYEALIHLAPHEVGARPYFELGRLYHKRGGDRAALAFLKRGRKIAPHRREISDLIKEITTQ